jgi:hypothetical protein
MAQIIPTIKPQDFINELIKPSQKSATEKIFSLTKQLGNTIKTPIKSVTGEQKIVQAAVQAVSQKNSTEVLGQLSQEASSITKLIPNPTVEKGSLPIKPDASVGQTNTKASPNQTKQSEQTSDMKTITINGLTLYLVANQSEPESSNEGIVKLPEKLKDVIINFLQKQTDTQTKETTKTEEKPMKSSSASQKAKKDQPDNSILSNALVSIYIPIKELPKIVSLLNNNTNQETKDDIKAVMPASESKSNQQLLDSNQSDPLSTITLSKQNKVQKQAALFQQLIGSENPSNTKKKVTQTETPSTPQLTKASDSVQILSAKPAPQTTYTIKEAVSNALKAIDQVSTIKEMNNKTLVINLNPKELGHVQINIEKNAQGTIQIDIQASSDKAASQIESLLKPAISSTNVQLQVIHFTPIDKSDVVQMNLNMKNDTTSINNSPQNTLNQATVNIAQFQPQHHSQNQNPQQQNPSSNHQSNQQNGQNQHQKSQNQK